MGTGSEITRIFIRRRWLIKVKSKELTKDQLIKELKQSEEHYHSIIESFPDGIVALDTKGFITSSNTSFSRITGISKEEAVGKHFWKLPILRTRDIPKYLKLFATLIRGEEIKHPLESTWIHKDGTQRSSEF